MGGSLQFLHSLMYLETSISSKTVRDILGLLFQEGIKMLKLRIIF